MYLLYPVLYFTNGLLTHRFLTSSSSKYSQLDLSIQHEIIGRWNNALTQIVIAAAIFSTNDPAFLSTLGSLFTTYLITDMIHMSMYCYEKIYYIHHIIPILTYYTAWNILSFESKLALSMTTAILELTTPPISLAWSLSKLELKGWYYPYVTAFAYLNFLALRIVYFPYFWLNYSPIFIKIVTVPYHAMNILWFGKMTSYALKQRQSPS